MSVRWEFASATAVDLELWDAKLIKAEAGEQLKPGELALTVGYDEVFAVVGTREQLRAFAQRVSEVVDEDALTIEEED